MDSILLRDSILFKYRYTSFSVIDEDTINSIHTLNSIDYLTIEYRDTVEYDTDLIFFMDTSYDDTKANRIDSIVEKTKKEELQDISKGYD